MKKPLIGIAVVSLLLTACSSTPVPTDTPKPVASNVTLVSQIPAWYKDQPADTRTEFYAVGTAKSADLGMVEHKAVVDAQTKLSFKLKGEMDAITKDSRRETDGAFTQTTEQAAKRVALGVDIAGYTIVERMIYPEDSGFRSFVLLKYPLRAQATDVEAGNAQAGLLHDELDGLKKERRESRRNSNAQAKPAASARSSTLVPVQQNGDLTIEITPATSDDADEDEDEEI